MRVIRENWLGLIGLIALCIAIPLPEAPIKISLNIIGFLALILYARLGKNALFFYFEIVALVGYILNITQVENMITYPLMIALSIAALTKVLSLAEFRKWYTIFGIIGLSGLVYGYLSNNSWGYIAGGIGMMIYGFIGFYHGVRVAFVFGILNLIYGSIAIYMLFGH